MDGMRIRSLEDIWPEQAELNKRVGFDTTRLGTELSVAAESGDEQRLGRLRVDVGKALKNYVDALGAECHELQECLSWKHWYREAREGRQYELQDLQNARVEATDMLFFWVSICQLLGLKPADVYRLYEKKLDINHRRQDEGRSQAEHPDHESENLGVL